MISVTEEELQIQSKQ